MTSGFYTAASGMLMQQRTLNVLANNITNQETPGYRSERLISTTFENEMTRVEGENTELIGKASPIRILSEVDSTFGAGIIEETGNPLDIAINGEGYFSIQGEDQTYLTRNGSFSVDEEGYLVLEDVGYVMGEGGGPIEVGGSGFKVWADGTVTGPDGDEFDKIAVTLPEQPELLVKLANGMYIDDGTQTMTTPETTTFVQNALEKSNVNFNREWSKIMEAQRSFQTCSTILKGMDEINKKAASSIAGL